MEYQYKEMKEVSKKLKSSDGGIWPYISFKTFLDEGLDKESSIFGDVTGTTGDTVHPFVSKEYDGEKKMMRLYRYHGKLSFFDKVLGYACVITPNGKKGYVRIIKKSMLKILLMIGILTAVCAGGMVALLWDNGPSLDKDAIAYQLPDGNKNTDPNSILLPGYDVLVMNYATQNVDIALLNPDGNECYFKYHIILKDSGNELYTTGFIKPGTAVTRFKVDKKMPKGKYAIIIRIDAADLKDPEKLYNGGAIEAVLEVK